MIVVHLKIHPPLLNPIGAGGGPQKVAAVASGGVVLNRADRNVEAEETLISPR